MKVSDIQSKIADWCVSACLTSGLAAIGVWVGLPNKMDSSAPSLSVIYIVAAMLAAVCVLSLIVRSIIVQPWVREVLRIYEPYEGVWIEQYKINEGSEGVEQLVDYCAITLIRAPGGPKPQLFRHTFIDDGCYRVGMFESQAVQFERTVGRVKFAYEGSYYKKDGSPDGEAWGFGYFKFERSLRSHRHPDVGHGSFIERDNTDKSWDPKDETKIERIPREDIKKIIGRHRPNGREDFQKLAAEYRPQHWPGSTG